MSYVVDEADRASAQDEVEWEAGEASYQVARDGELWIVSKGERWWTVSADECVIIGDSGRSVTPSGRLGRSLLAAVRRAQPRDLLAELLASLEPITRKTKDNNNDYTGEGV